MKAKTSTSRIYYGYSPYHKLKASRDNEKKCEETSVNDENLQPDRNSPQYKLALAKKVAEKITSRVAPTPMRWLALIPPEITCESAESKLHHEIVAFQRWTTPTRQESEARELILDCVDMLAKRCIEGATAQVFGSSATSLSLPTADIDIAISTKSNVDRKYALSQLACTIQAAQLTTHVMRILHAKVPIIKFVTRPEYGSLSVDISFNNPGGTQAVGAISDYLSEMPALRPLVLVVKALVAKHGLNEPSSSGLGSYAIVCMCIFFIKINPCKRAPAFYDPLQCESLGILLADFLWYFSKQFPFSTSHISAKDGKLYPRTEFESDKLVPMSVQCLINPGNNAAKCVGRIALERIVNIFERGFADITQASVRDKSILGQLIAIEDQAHKCRVKVRDAVDSGALKLFLIKLRASRTAGAQSTVPLTQNVCNAVDIGALKALLAKLRALQAAKPQPRIQNTLPSKSCLNVTYAAHHRLQFYDPRDPYLLL